MSVTEVLAFCTGVVGLLSAVAMGFYAFRNNASSIKNDIIKTYETRLTQLDTDMKAVKKQLEEMSAKFDRSEEARKRAEEILQGRNPELERFMTLSLQLLTEIHAAVLPQTVSQT